MNEFRLLDDDDYPYNNYCYDQSSDFCPECEPRFITCEKCSGYFDIEFFIDNHEGMCQLKHQIYQDKENLVECKDCKSYVKYDQFSQHKEICVNAIKDDKVQCGCCNQTFSLSLIEEHEKTCQLITNEMMILRETIKCSFCNEKVSSAHFKFHEVKCQKLKEKQKKIEEQIQLMKIEYPAEWDQEIFSVESIDQNLSVITLGRNGQEFQFAAELFNKTVGDVQVNNVFRVQNKYLWEKYSKEKAKIMEEKGNAEENWLFHGTRANNPKSLYTIGFDISFASDQGSFGRGVYFARQAAYSHQGYCYTSGDKGYIFIAKVITGIPYVSQNGAGYKKPPFMNESKFIYYDSVTNADNKNNAHVSQMYIVYENDKAYPFYLIEYSINNSVNLSRHKSKLIKPVIQKQVNRNNIKRK